MFSRHVTLSLLHVLCLRWCCSAVDEQLASFLAAILTQRIESMHEDIQLMVAWLCSSQPANGHMAFALIGSCARQSRFLRSFLTQSRILPVSSNRFSLFSFAFASKLAPLPRTSSPSFLYFADFRLPLPLTELGCSTAVVCCQRHPREHNVT